MRLAGKLLLLLCAASILNVAVAWAINEGCADQRQTMPKWPEWTTLRSIDALGWTFAEQSQFGVRRAVAQRFPTVEGSGAVDVPADALPSWSTIRELDAIEPISPAEAGTLVVLYEDWAFGWPCTSMAFRYKSVTRWPDGSSIQLGSRHFPVKPLWGPFVANTVVYAAALWAVAAVPFRLRGFLRRRSGRCARCAYSVPRSSRCPECGSAT